MALKVFPVCSCKVAKMLQQFEVDTFVGTADCSPVLLEFFRYLSEKMIRFGNKMLQIPGVRKCFRVGAEMLTNVAQTFKLFLQFDHLPAV